MALSKEELEQVLKQLNEILNLPENQATYEPIKK